MITGSSPGGLHGSCGGGGGPHGSCGGGVLMTMMPGPTGNGNIIGGMMIGMGTISGMSTGVG